MTDGKVTSRALRSVTVVGRGKVGAALARATAAAGLDVKLESSRTRVRPRPADLFVVAVADGAVATVAERVAASGVPPSVIVHTAGILEPDHLAALRAGGWAVGQAHPLVSFAGARRSRIEGATLLIGGDRAAAARCRQLARALGMHPLAPHALDRAAWHAVAALVANGAAALAALGAARWAREGIGEKESSRALGALLASVAANIEALGATRALSGPVRRGDATAVGRHLRALGPERSAGSAMQLAYAALALAQIPVARAIGEAPSAGLLAIEALARTVLVESTGPLDQARAHSKQAQSKQDSDARRRKRP